VCNYLRISFYYIYIVSRSVCQSRCFMGARQACACSSEETLWPEHAVPGLYHDGHKPWRSHNMPMTNNAALQHYTPCLMN